MMTRSIAMYVVYILLVVSSGVLIEGTQEEENGINTCRLRIPCSSNISEIYPPLDDSDSMNTPVFFSLMVGEQSIASINTSKLALDHINGDPNLLNGYRLHFTLTPYNCSGSDLVDKALTQLYSEPGGCKKLGLITTGCATASTAIVPILSNLGHHFNIPEISCSPGTSPYLTHTLKTYPSEDVFMPALGNIISHYQWTKVGLIVEDKPKYTQMIKVLKGLRQNVTFTTTRLDSQGDSLKVVESSTEEIFVPGTRIFIVAMSSRMSRHLLCEAFRLNVKYPKYVLVFVTEHSPSWWERSHEQEYNSCTARQRAEVLRYSIAFKLNTTYNQYESYCYDAVLTLAFALNKTLKGDIDLGTVGCVYQNDSVYHQLQNYTQETEFDGVTGHVKFGLNGQRLTDDIEIMIVQFQNENAKVNGILKAVNIGSLTQGELVIMNTTKWPEGTPYDGSVVIQTVTISIPLAIVFNVIATLGLIFTLICCVFNFAFRRKKVVRLASPNLNYLILIGALLSYSSVYWYFVPSVNPSVILASCSMRICLIVVAFYLVLGTIFAKLWRIYYIFRNPDSAKKKAITDCHLFGFVLLYVTVAMLVLLVYTAVEIGTPGYELRRAINEDYPIDIVGAQEISIQYEYDTCERVPNLRTVCTGILFGIIGILMIIVLFMVIKTRKIRIKGLNDAKYITGMVYVTSLVFVAQIIINFTFGNRINTYPAVTATFHISATTLLLALVFIPKMIHLYRDPDGEHIFTLSDPHCKAGPLMTIFANNQAIKSDCSGCQQLQARLDRMERALKGGSKNSQSALEPINCKLAGSNDGSQETGLDDMSFDDQESTLNISWADDGSTFHIGYRV